nr:reverse transcriptase domain-containing protein [Tanacetum cinerariifolium]
MSFASSAVTYTSVYTDSEPGRVFWGADEELSDGGSPRVIVYGYDGLPMQSVAPPSPDYIPGPEEPQTPPVSQDEDECEPMFIQPHDPNYVPEPMYPEYIPLEDEHVLSAEEQPLPPIDSPTAESPGYVTELDLEEYKDDESEDGPVDYPMDGGDDGDDDDIDSSGDDADDEDEDEEEEHLAPADSAIVIPTVELASISLPPKAEVERILAMPTPPPSPLALLSPPSAGERLARDDVPETEMPPGKRLCLSTQSSRYEIGESSTARPTRGREINYGFVSTLDVEARRRGIGEVGYGIRDTWVDPTEAVPEIAPMTLREVNTRVTELAELHKHDTQDLYALLEDAQDSRTRISQRVTMDSQRVDLIMEDRIAHQETILIMEEEAYAAREAWAHSIGLSQAIHSDLQTHREQQAEMAELRETDRRRQAELLALREQLRRARQPGSDARVPDHQDTPRDADSHIQIMAPVTRQGPNIPPNNTNPNNMTPESVKFATCTLLDATLTWWNSQIRSLGPEAYSMTWEVKGNDVPTYTKRFQELTLICTKFVANKTEKINKYISGLPDNIYGSVKSSKPKTLDETIESSGNTNVANTERENRAIPKGNGCFECGAPGHFKRDCPKLKNKDGGNVNAQGWVYAVGNAEKKENASRDPYSNVVTGSFILNNRYASILFDTGADRSFISTAFSSLIDIVPTPLGNSYDVELADGNIVRVNTIMRGCTLNFLNHPFNIDLMPVELGSFDVIIGMDWLRKYHAVIVCDEKLVRVPYGNKTLIFSGNESSDRRESRLTIISCSKTQEYMAKGCQIFLAQISAKKEEDKSKGKQLKDVPIV